MNKKILNLFLIFLLFNFALCTYSAETSWGENSEVFNQGFQDQKAVSDSKLKNTIKTLKDMNLSRKQKKMQKEVQPLSPTYDSDYLKNFADTEAPDSQLNNSHTVMIPMQAYSEDGRYISPGYYKLSCRKIGENKYVLDLSQGNEVVLTVEAIQTQQDLEQESVSFCNAEILDKGRIRLMYGTIDLNLVGYIYFK